MIRNHASAPLLLPKPVVLRLFALLILTAPAILWIGRYTDIDLNLADAVFNTATTNFPWRHSWFAETFNHGILKWILISLAMVFIGTAAIDVLRPIACLGVADRLRLRVVALSAVMVPAVISGLKQISSSHCPWDLTRYGGTQPYVRIFDMLPIGAVPGNCLPGGHASSALWLISLAVFWLPGRPRTARSAVLAGLVFSGGVGFLQQLRGAHFLTHTLWSIWLACAIVLIIVFLAQFKRRSAIPALSPAMVEVRVSAGQS